MLPRTRLQLTVTSTPPSRSTRRSSAAAPADWPRQSSASSVPAAHSAARSRSVRPPPRRTGSDRERAFIHTTVERGVIVRERRGVRDLELQAAATAAPAAAGGIGAGAAGRDGDGGVVEGAHGVAGGGEVLRQPRSAAAGVQHARRRRQVSEKSLRRVGAAGTVGAARASERVVCSAAPAPRRMRLRERLSCGFGRARAGPAGGWRRPHLLDGARGAYAVPALIPLKRDPAGLRARARVARGTAVAQQRVRRRSTDATTQTR